MPCACAQSSLTPRHSGNAASAACAAPPTKSISPSRSAAYARSTGKISSTETSSPSPRKKPSSAAATAGKYEFEIRSGIASFMSGRVQVFRTQFVVVALPRRPRSQPRTRAGVSGRSCTSAPTRNKRIVDGRDDGGRRPDRAALADPLDAELGVRRRRFHVQDADVRDLGGARQQIVEHSVAASGWPWARTGWLRTGTCRCPGTVPPRTWPSTIMGLTSDAAVLDHDVVENLDAPGFRIDGDERRVRRIAERAAVAFGAIAGGDFEPAGIDVGRQVLGLQIPGAPDVAQASRSRARPPRRRPPSKPSRGRPAAAMRRSASHARPGRVTPAPRRRRPSRSTREPQVQVEKGT